MMIGGRGERASEMRGVVPNLCRMAPDLLTPLQREKNKGRTVASWSLTRGGRERYGARMPCMAWPAPSLAKQR
jgi:hypothetical protein